MSLAVILSFIVWLVVARLLDDSDRSGALLLEMCAVLFCFILICVLLTFIDMIIPLFLKFLL